VRPFAAEAQSLGVASSYFRPRYTSSVIGAPCEVVELPIVMNIMVKVSSGADPCQCIVAGGT